MQFAQFISRIESNLSKITIILEQGEWSSAKDVGPIFKRCNARKQQAFLNMVNVCVFNIGSICIHAWERITQKIYIALKIQGKISLKNRCSTYLKSWSNNQMRFLECLKSAGKIFHGDNHLWSMMKKSSVSRIQRFMYFQILCYVLERRIRTQHQVLFGKNSWVGSKIHQNTELRTQLTESRWNSSGIFPRIHHIAARRQSPRVHDQNGQPSTIPRTNYLRVDVRWHHMVIYRQCMGMYC